MWGAFIGDMVGASFRDKLNNSCRFEVSEHFGEATENTLLITALEEYLSYDPEPPAGKIAGKLAAREIAGLQKKHLSRLPELADDPRSRWISRAGLSRCIAPAAFSPVLALPLAYVCDDVEELISHAELTCAYISDCGESREAAVAAAVILFSLLHGVDKSEINEVCEPFCGFPLDTDYREIQEQLAVSGQPRELIQGAVAALVKSYDFDSAVRFAAALGRETQTLCALAGAMAEACYGKPPEELTDCVLCKLDIITKTKAEKFLKKYINKFLKST